MSSVVVQERRASRDEVLAHRETLLTLAAACGLTDLRLRDDGAVVVTSAAPGYRSVARFIDAASGAVGAFVYVMTDDVPSAGAATTRL